METIPMHFTVRPTFENSSHLFLRRTAAYLIDVLPLLLLSQWGLYLAWGYSPLAPVGQEIEWRGECFSEARFARTTARYLAFFLWLIYSAIFEASSWQASPGKKWLGLQVRTAQGHRLTFPQACCRNGLKLLSYLPFGLGFLYMAYDPQRLTWHDRMSETVVIEKKKPVLPAKSRNSHK